MLTQGIGETFNFVVPVRELVKWGEEAGVSWLFDPKITPPTWEELKKLPVEGAAATEDEADGKVSKPKGKNHFYLYKPADCDECGQRVYDGHSKDD